MGTPKSLPSHLLGRVGVRSAGGGELVEDGRDGRGVVGEPPQEQSVDAVTEGGHEVLTQFPKSLTDAG